jgi:hypothetical protein
MTSYGCHDLNEAQAEAPLEPVNAAVNLAGSSKGTANQAIVKVLTASKNWFSDRCSEQCARTNIELSVFGYLL